MSLVDACLVRMTETLAHPVILTPTRIFAFVGVIAAKSFLARPLKRRAPFGSQFNGVPPIRQSLKLCAGENRCGDSAVCGIFDGQFAGSDRQRRFLEHLFQIAAQLRSFLLNTSLRQHGRVDIQ